MKTILRVSLLLAIVLAVVVPSTYATTIKYAFAFVDRFPEEAGPLGFDTGNVLQVGAFITAGDSPITEVTAKNLDTGLVLELSQINVGTIYKNLLYEFTPFPPFDPSKHKGVWEIRVKDADGNEVVAKTHRLDKEEKMPYVANIRASGSPFAPTITWDAPKKEDCPSGCKLGYKVRLLKNNQSQFYKSKKLLSDTKETIPKGFIKYEDIPDTYIRIECQCLDVDDMDHPVPLELRSETFQPFVEAFSL